MPEKPRLPTITDIVIMNVMARRLQNAFINYKIELAERREREEAANYVTMMDSLETANAREIGRSELMMLEQDGALAAGDDATVNGLEKGQSLKKIIKKNVNVLDVPWVPPDIQKAIEFGNYAQPRKGGKGGVIFDYFKTTTGRHCCLGGLGEQFDLWEEGQTSEFGVYGSGVTNYFKFMKWAFWVFVLLTISALPIMVLNMSGHNSKRGLAAISKTTIGNLAIVSSSEIYYNSGIFTIVNTNVSSTIDVKIPGCSSYGFVNINCDLNGNDLALFYAIIDIVISAILFCGYIWLTIFEHIEEDGLEESTVNAAMYTIAVSNLPKNFTEEELFDHFNKVAENPLAVAQIAIAYDNIAEISEFIARGDIVRSKVHLVHEHRHKCTMLRADLSAEEADKQIEKEREKFFDKMRKLNDNLKVKEARLAELAKTNPTPVMAYITFNKMADRNLVYEKYNHASMWTLLCNSRSLKIRGKLAIVGEAPEPSVIMWENIPVTMVQKFWRRFFTFVLSLVLIVVSLLMVFASKYLDHKTANNGSSKSIVCPGNFGHLPSSEQIDFVAANPYYLQCYCEQFNTIEQARDPTCQHYLQNVIYAQVLQYFASFIVVIVNQVIDRVVRFSGDFERHSTGDNRGMSVFVRLFILKYINTAGLFLINGNNVILRTVFGISDQGSSSEFSLEWYSTVAVTVVLVQLGDIFLCHGGRIYSYFTFLREKSYYYKNPNKALTQDELNKKFVGNEFEFAHSYAQMMSSFCVCLTFSTGIPILYPLAAANYLIYYFMEKYMFIHCYQIPPHFSTKVGRMATRLVPVALLVHLGMSIWFLSNNEIFAAQAKTSSITAAQTSYLGNSVHDRLTGRATFPLFMTWVAVIGLHVIYFLVNLFRNTLQKVSKTRFFLCSL